MKINAAFFIPAILLISACGSQPTSPTEEGTKAEFAWKMPDLKYPETRVTNHVDTYFGHEVKDPYSWLEADYMTPEIQEWIGQQQEFTTSVLSDIPFREKIEKRYAEILNYPKAGSPRRVGDWYFISKNDGLQNQAVIYYKDGRDGDEQVFIDPNALSEEGTVAISLSGASADNKYMAYTRSDAGSDWQSIYIRDIATNADLADKLDWVKFSGASWYKDGFFYSRYPAPKEGEELLALNEFHSVYYHKLGTSQDEDVLIHKSDNPKLYHWGWVTEDDQYFIMSASTGTDGFETLYMPLDGPVTGGNFTKLFAGFDHKSNVIDHVDGHFLVHTDIDAPNYRLVSVDLANPDPANWTELIAEKEHLLEGANTAGGELFALYLENACTQVYQMNYDGSNVKKIKLPGAGSAYGFGGKKDYKTVFYSYTSFTNPGTIFEYNIGTGESEEFFAPELKFDPNEYESKQVFYPSKDGTQISMFVVHKKGLKLDGNRPTMLYGYGGFNVSLTPSFSVSNMILLENGGVYAMANLRGGGEFGEEWHQAGMLTSKQNVFDDFIAAGEYLVNEGYTSSKRLAIAGGSNGGLLVGACMAQRPELFQVAFPAVGVLDMLRFHTFTVGWGWVPEYGSSEQSEEMFQYLYGYSPLHNLKPGTDYPATLVTTADHDDRVHPAHSFKFAAQLQAAHAGESPVLIRIESDAGHGAGKPTEKVIEEQADKWAFMFANMGFEPMYEDEHAHEEHDDD